MSVHSAHDDGLAIYILPHPWLFLSLLIHIAIIFFISNHTSEASKIQQQKQYEQQKSRITASVKKANQVETAQRADNIEKIKSLMEKSVKNNTTKSDTTEPPQDKTTTSPEELLADAKKSLADIKKIADAIRVEELSRVLDISREEALDRVTKENLKKEISAQENKKNNVAPEETAKTIRKLEQEAYTALTLRQKQLAKMNNGINIQSGGAQDGKGYQPGDGTGIGQAWQDINLFLGRHNYSMPKPIFGDFGFIPTAEGTAHKKVGRVIGAGGEYAERIYLNSWYLIGPFAGFEYPELFKNPIYPPEQFIDLDAVYFGKDNRVLTWQYVKSKSYPLIPPNPAENAVYYGYTEIKIDKATDMWLWIGSDDDIKVWLNQDVIWEGGYSKQWYWEEVVPNRERYVAEWNLSEDKVKIHLNAGRNKILFKLSNGPYAENGYFASLVLTKY